MILPLLTLCAACSTSVSHPSVVATATAAGNAYRLQLPAGTQITLPTQASADQVRAVAVNETTAAGRTLTLTTPLQLISPAYIAERNAAEATLRLRLADLTEENTRLRDSK